LALHDNLYAVPDSQLDDFGPKAIAAIAEFCHHLG
jgi:hypothetical protein